MAGNISLLPTHQETELIPKSPIINIDTAAGLKTKFFLIAKIYFEPIAIKEITMKTISEFLSLIGVNKKNKITEVIQTDSAFVSTLNIFAKWWLEI